MPSTSITSLLWPVGSNVAITGEVFEAEATETRYMLRGCYPSSDKGCDYQTEFVNFGPWASETLPKGAAATGIYDVHGTVNGTVYSSVCEMSRSVIEKCTVSKQSGWDDSTEYTTTRTKGETGADFTLSYHAVTLTGGFEKFASVSEATPASMITSTAEPTSTAEASTTTDTSLDSVNDDPSTTDMDISNTAAAITETTTSAVPTETVSAGSRPLVRALAVVALAGMATALIA
ncbi:hypothetical protein FPSE_04380 [Fusarium pseudograminearum CS3096]|uniref:Uncharacterized protein n=1 Tax=Fusarium pseudograminearum (strain CS3096) TaxID=1028729 RepID=K3VKQ7_FUSPC|nr:hypothetical protein FPSE_04380 [Fusarium pseudograminearum CS3096]EKJ75427.1 hypothetical protein FPSE_04380 [Fusarium pseudograminearum CS3096]